MGQFPTINCTCLRLLFAFLYRVSLCSADNKMTTENLGIVFAPNLLRAPNATDMNVMDLQVSERGGGRGGGMWMRRQSCGGSVLVRVFFSCVHV